jgi:acyl-homoserine-lactone acylase
MASGNWGALASYGANSYNTKRLYGTSGNSFVAVVEFGDKVKAKTILAGGQSGDPNSPHFNDQAQRYADVQLQGRSLLPRRCREKSQSHLQAGAEGE